jgi:hypothetical protein
LFVFLLVGIGLGVLSGGPASAWVLNACRYQYTVTFYKFSNVTSTWQSAHNSGAGRWNATTNQPDLVQTSQSTVDQWVYDDNYSATWSGLASGGCVPGSYWYNNLVTVQYNLNQTVGWTTGWRQALAVHEQGHAWGLAHNSNNCTNKSAMRDDARWVLLNCSNPGTPPWQDDINGKEQLY